MKKLIILLCFCLMTFGSSARIIEVAPAGAWGVLGISGGGAVAGGGADYTEERTDTFSDTNTPPTGWTESSGSWTEDSTEMYRDAYASNNYIRFSTAITSADHYVCIKINDVRGSSANPGVAFRMTTNTADEYYIIRADNNANELHFRNCDAAPAACNTFYTVTSFGDLTDGQTICGAVEGTTTSTVFYFWEDPAAIPPTKALADYKICRIEFDGTCTDWDAAPNVYGDAGTYVGVADMNGSVDHFCDFDDFSAGPD